MYQVMVINPEILMGNTTLEGLWKKPKFTSRLLCFIFDEGHCISQWGAFRNEYLLLGNLRYLIPKTIPFYVASATLPLDVLLDVTKILHLRPGETEHITCDGSKIYVNKADEPNKVARLY
jgi:superfamily II DNA helicase RecQ